MNSQKIFAQAATKNLSRYFLWVTPGTIEIKRTSHKPTKPSWSVLSKPWMGMGSMHSSLTAIKVSFCD